MPKVTCSRARPLDEEAYDRDVLAEPPGVWGWLLGQTDLVVTLGQGKVLAPAYPAVWDFYEGRRFCRAAAPGAGRVLLTVGLGG